MRIHISLLAILFVIVLQSKSVHAQCCNYTLMMQDSYGDGWNGGFLEIFRNDTSLGTFSGFGFGSAASISLCEGDSIRFFYTGGMYENENSYELYSPGWQLILEAGPDPAVGEVHVFEVHCDTIDLPGNHPCTAIPIDTSDCAIADNSVYSSSGLNPFCAEFQGGDMWFVLQVPPSGNISIQTDSGSIGDTGLAVWTDDACTEIRLIGCDDDAGIDAYSFLSFYELDPTNNLYVQIFGYAGARGSFRLCAKDLGVVTLDSSELPIISILTNGQEIVNDPKIDALMQIRYNGPGNITHLSDNPNVYDGHIGIEIRGASSAGYPQRPYGLETRDADGEDLNVSLLGIPEEADWVMISNFNDRSLIRNTLSHKLFTAMGQYSPRMQLCEVLLDSIYKGIYVFGEKIKRDKYRVNIANLKPEDVEGDALSGGYILQQNYWDPTTSFQSNYGPIDHPEFDVHFVYEFPKPEDITEVQKTYIAFFVDSLETALYSDDFTDPETGYRKYLDEQSFIDYFLLNELARNNDGFKKSVFFHKDRFSKGGKLKAGPAWDFDWAWKNMHGCDIFSAIDGSGWAHHINDCPTDNYSCGWYIRLFQDSTFLDNLKCSYETYRETIFDTAYIFQYIDSMGILVANAQERHFKKWPILGISGPAPEVNAIATTYTAELDTLKHWINLRLDWLDANMPGLCEQTTSSHKISSSKAWANVYPNPAKDFIWMEVKEEANLDILDLNGKIVSGRIPLSVGERKQVDMSSFPSGMYIFRIYNEHHMQLKKVVITK